MICRRETGSAELNPDGVWSIDAQLETELFGLIAPGMPQQAAERAQYFAKVTNSGLAVDVSAFYAVLYALAFAESDVPTLISEVQAYPGEERTARWIVDNVSPMAQALSRRLATDTSPDPRRL